MCCACARKRTGAASPYNSRRKAGETKQLYEEVSRTMSKLFYRGFAGEEITHFEKNLERILANLAE